MAKKILIGYPISPQRIQQISQGFEVDCIQVKEGRYEAVYEIVQNYQGLLALWHKVDKALLNKGKQLEIVSNFGVGYDNIDVQYARQKQIAIANTPNSVLHPTANHAMGLILAQMRAIVKTDRGLRNKSITNWGSSDHLGKSIENKILGIIGMGRIGKAVAKRAIPFGFNILYHNRNRLDPDIESAHQATYVSLEELLKRSDVVSLHLPLNEHTKGFLNEQYFHQMKSSAILVNTARGGVVDQAALIQALQNKTIAGAALDVFWNEPEIPAVLFQFDNVILNPHIGTGTKEARREMFDEAFGNIVAFLKGDPMTNRVV